METDNQKYINELKKRIHQLEFLCNLQAEEMKKLKDEIKRLKEQIAFNAIDDWFSDDEPKNNRENDEPLND